MCQSTPGPPIPCFVAQSFGLWHRALLVAQSFAFASGNSYFTNSRVQKHKNSAGAEFLDSLLLVVAQSFGCGTELGVVAQSFAFAVFATLICQINIVFPCKDTKAQNRLCAGKYLETC